MYNLALFGYLNVGFVFSFINKCEELFFIDFVTHTSVFFLCNESPYFYRTVVKVLFATSLRSPDYVMFFFILDFLPGAGGYLTDVWMEGYRPF